MKKYGALIALGCAVLFGILAVILASKWLEKQTSPETAQMRMKETLPITRIVTATEDVPVGTFLTEKNIALTEWPSTTLPKGHFTDLNVVKGRVAVTKLVAGEPLLAAELAAPGSGAGLVAMIPVGMRAMSIRVDEVIGVSGFILPDTFVDIITQEKAGDAAKPAKTFLARVPVLAIAQQSVSEDGKPKVVHTVTLQLTPTDAEKLVTQMSKANMHLVLRNPLDTPTEEKEVERATVAAPRLSTVPPRRPRVSAATAKPTPRKQHKVEILRQLKLEIITCENGDSYNCSK
ncbi:MAG: Flp pilus assembly protein CpaB [Desulfobulbaceae bacterium]|nr:Flp pilus assembly protein CpaB [Desulfobulbaceae bacterium]